MSIRRAIFATCLAAIMAIASDVPARAVDQELFGLWLAESHQFGSKLNVCETIEFRPDGCQYRGKKTRYKVDPGANPKTIDLLEGIPILGVYAVDGDSLRLCINDMLLTKRPAGFESKQGDDTYRVMICRRVTPESVNRLVREETAAVIDELIAQLDAKRYDTVIEKLGIERDPSKPGDKEQLTAEMTTRADDVRKALIAIRHMQPKARKGHRIEADFEFQSGHALAGLFGGVNLERRGKLDWTFEILKRPLTSTEIADRNGPRCPKCGAVYPGSQLTRDDRSLLEMRAELNWLHRVAAYQTRHPNGIRDAGGPNWTAEDRQVAEYLKTRIFFLEPRMKFVKGRVAELTAKVGDHLRCRQCREADVEREIK